VLTFDPEAFREHLEDFDFTDEEAAAFLEALWSILVGFVDLGFEIHPVQQATAADAKNLARDSNAMLAFNRNSIKTNNDRNANGPHGCNAAGADS
jgi:hypothetical protein